MPRRESPTSDASRNTVTIAALIRRASPVDSTGRRRRYRMLCAAMGAVGEKTAVDHTPTVIRRASFQSPRSTSLIRYAFARISSSETSAAVPFARCRGIEPSAGLCSREGETRQELEQRSSLFRQVYPSVANGPQVSVVGSLRCVSLCHESWRQQLAMDRRRVLRRPMREAPGSVPFQAACRALRGAEPRPGNAPRSCQAAAI